MKKNKFKEKEKKVAYDIAAPAKEEKKKVLDFENEGTRFLVILLAIVAIISMLWLVNILKENKKDTNFCIYLETGNVAMDLAILTSSSFDKSSDTT